MMLPDPAELCNVFCHILNEWLPADTMAEVNRRNALPEYARCCASHDFCDPNEAMSQAIESFGLAFRADDEPLVNLINSAWDLAKARQFSEV